MLKDIAEQMVGKKKVILVHGNADMDAVGSAYAIAECFGPADIFAPNSIDRVAKMVSEKIDFKVIETCDLSDYEMVISVDTSSPEQFGSDISLPSDTLVIDHHQRTGKWDSYNCYIDDTKVACVEIILDMIRECEVELPRNVGLMLLAGMITDSGHFQYADPVLLKDFAYILETTGIQMDEALDLTKNEMSMSERVSMMKYVERSKFDRVGDMIVATSYGGSYEASGCRALLSSGADVVFVASQREDEFRLSARATQNMVRRGINLGDILKDIGTETITDGGGHEGAAGLSGIGDVEAMLHICMQRTMEEFRKIKRRGDVQADTPDD